MSEPDCPSLPRPLRRSSRRWWPLGGVLLALACLSLGTYAYFHYAAALRLREAIAAVDAADPGWQMEDLEAHRGVIPDAENAALRVQAAAAMLPPTWTKFRALAKALEQMPASQLNEQQIVLLRKQLEQGSAALSEARKLASLSTGRFTAQETPDWLHSLPLHLNQVGQVMDLLEYDALERIQYGDTPGALRSCRGEAVAGRALGDEPMPMSQVFRISAVVMGLRTVERALAQGQATDADLASLERLLEEEDAHPGLLIALRGERALLHGLLERFETGDLWVGVVTHQPVPSSPVGRLMSLVERNAIRSDHARFLEAITEQIRRAQQSFETLPGPFQSAPGFYYRDYHSVVELLEDGVQTLGPNFQHFHALLRCGVVMLAAERFRLANERWPGSMEELVPRFLTRPIPDPYYGKPIRLRRLEGGLLIYSIGPDGVDDGGAIDPPQPGKPSPDIGFRLWNVDKRRQPPAPPPPDGGAIPRDK
jgi:hypothetical protein